MSTTSHETVTNLIREGEDLIHRIRTAGSASTPALFEKLYLTPANDINSDLKQKFANPTPVALAGFILCTTPLSMILLGWRGAGGLGAANVGSYFYCGGMLLVLGGVGEFLLGNTFPTVVFLTYGAFWCTFGATLVPSYGAISACSPDPITHPEAGLKSPTFEVTFAFFLVSMAVLSTVFAITSLRTNIVFFTIFVLLVPTFSLLAAAFFSLAIGDIRTSDACQHVGAGILLAVSLLGWYIFIALVLAGVDFPIAIPLGDLSTVIKRSNEKKEVRDE